jgi:RNA polymerase sigma-70 factor (ECF subfamily)
MEHVLQIRGLAAGAKPRMQENVDPELEWIRQIAAGDRDAFEKLYKAYQTRLFRYLLRMVGDTGKAEELTNDTMVAAWKAAGSFKGQSKPSTWLFAIARNKALNAMRGLQPVMVDVETAVAVVATSDSPEKTVSRGNLQAAMKQALNQLSADHREVVELAFYQELSYQEIAEIMQSPVNTVKTRMFYAKKKLQEVLTQSGLSGELI